MGVAAAPETRQVLLAGMKALSHRLDHVFINSNE
jgi:hypothetical protein